MSETDASDDAGGQDKIEAWMSVSLKENASQRADDFDVSMAEYIRRLIRADARGELLGE